MKKLASIWNDLKTLGWLVVGVLMYVFVGLLINEAIKSMML